MLSLLRGLARGLWEGWKRVAKRIGDVQARLLLLVFYFVVFAPFALAVRWGSDPLALKPGGLRGWHEKPEVETDLMKAAARQH